VIEMKASAWKLLPAAVALSLLGSSALAQAPRAPAADVTARSIKAVGYQVNRGDTTFDLKGTELGAGAVGEAKVEAKTAVTSVEARLRGSGRAARWVPSSWPT